jgi:hypothetical protein
LDIFLYVLPSFALQRLEDGAAKKVLIDLIKGCALAALHQWSIEERDLRKIKL